MDPPVEEVHMPFVIQWCRTKGFQIGAFIRMIVRTIERLAAYRRLAKGWFTLRD